MLSMLCVKNLALVEEIRISLHPGLNVITGETGAGKSVLMGALALLTGDRADRNMIRAGADQCSAEALFELADPAAVNEVLSSCDLPLCEEGQLIIRRTVRAAGSSQNLVNDSPVTLNVLRRLGDALVDMHGPHDHQSLLHQDAQLEILDAFGKLQKARSGYEAVYRDRLQLLQRMERLQETEDDVEELLDLLRYRVKELEEAELKPDEEQAITEEHTVAGNASRILELANGLRSGLVEGDGCVFDVLAAMQSSAEELARLMPVLEPWQEELAQVSSRLQELDLTLSGEISRIESDPGRMAWLDERMTTYQKMRRKYGGSVESALEVLEKSRERLEDVESREERLKEAEAELQRVDGLLKKAGAVLTAGRKKVSGKLAGQITSELEALGFPHGAFEVNLSAAEPGPLGLDDIEFGFAPNVGEPVRPLRAIASSGEISRVMLATKAVLARHDRIPVLVFDEIDANVGGEMGSAVGQKMSKVADHRQVITITHLPQVATAGGHHLAVSKEVTGDRTFTRVRELEREERVEEIARMLGGRDLTGVTLQHAREMLDQA